MGLIFKKSTAQPAFTVAAAITGTARVGQTLTCAYTVTKARANNVTVRWYSYFDNTGTDQVLIGTGATYVLTGNELGRYIRAIVTASNPAGSVQSTSSYTVAVTNEAPPDPPTVTSTAAITGTLEVGQTLTVSVTFSGADSVAYQWYSYTSAGGAGASALGTSTTQALTVAEDGKYIGCQATGTNASGSTVSTAALVGPVAANVSEAPTVVSAAVIALDDGANGYNEGEYIICDAEFSGHTATPTFTWYKCDAGKTNPVELTGAGVEPIRPLFVSEPNHWRGALFLDQSLGLHIGGKYVYCVASATNGEGTTPSESDAVGPIGAIQGTPITQAMVGNGPYYLTAVNGTYYLAEDISTHGTAFLANTQGVKLNLNGKTITFDNDAPTGLVNGGFETGDFTGWDVSNAPAASIYTVTNALDDWNLAKYSTGNYSCTFSTAIHQAPVVEQYMQQSGITLTRNVWYAFTAVVNSNSAVPVTLSVIKDGQVLWSNTARPGASNEPWRGMATLEVVFQAYHADPTYDFRVSVTGSEGSSKVVYVDDVQLTRTRIAGFAMPVINYSSGRVAEQIEIVNGGSGYQDGVYTDVLSTRVSGQTLYTTTAYPKLNVTVSGGSVTAVSLSTPGAAAFYTNDLVVTVPAASIGGTGSGFTAAINGLRIWEYSHKTFAADVFTPLDHGTRLNYGISARVVKNGRIVQGQGASTFVCAINADADGSFATGTPCIRIHRVDCEVTGHNSCAAAHRSSGRSDIRDSVFRVSHRVCAKRDWNFASAVKGLPGVFARNTVYHSAGGGYYPRSVSAQTVYGNRFYSKMHHSNQSCIGCQGNGTVVYDNLIDNTGEYYGRCVHISASGLQEIYNNRIYGQPSLWNAEYQGTNYGGDVAFQVEQGKVGGIVDIHDNVIEYTAQNAITTAGEPLMAGCMRWSSLNAGTVQIRNNTLTARAVGAGYAWAWLTDDTYAAATFDVRDNTISTDSGYFAAGNSLNVSVVGENVSLSSLVANERRLFVIEYDEPDIPNSAEGYALVLDLVDMVASPADWATLTTERAKVFPRYGSAEPTGKGGYRIKWTTTIATEQAGATVVIKDSGGTTVASGTAEADGTFIARLQQYFITSAAPLDTSSYTVTVNGGTPVAFTADSVQTINAPA